MGQYWLVVERPYHVVVMSHFTLNLLRNPGFLD
jgi:hypothetical protein